MYLLVFSVISAFALSSGFLYRYGNIQRQHPIVTISVLIAWAFSFLIVFTIPLDVTSVSNFLISMNHLSFVLSSEIILDCVSSV